MTSSLPLVIRLAMVLLSTLEAIAPAAAQPAACDGVGIVSFSPAHPSTTDRISYGVTLPADPIGKGTPIRVWTSHAVNPAQAPSEYSIQIAVYIASVMIPFSGAPVASPFPYTPMMQSMPPLLAGRYTSRAAVLIYNAGLRVFEELCPPPLSPALVVATEGGLTSHAPVIEYFNPELDHYFISQNASEIAALDAGGAWSRTGQTFLAYTPLSSDRRGEPLYRYYSLPSSSLDSHVFTLNLLERDALAGRTMSAVWLKESDDAFEAAVPDTSTGQCPVGTGPVYRLCNSRADSAHRYTTSVAIRDEMIARGYVLEGFGVGLNTVAMCSLLQ